MLKTAWWPPAYFDISRAEIAAPVPAARRRRCGASGLHNLQRRPRSPAQPSFALVGAASGLGSALLGSVGPLTAPFFLALGLTRGGYIGTEATSALTIHLTKIATYGAGDLLTARVLLAGLVLTPATLLGTWAGKKIIGRTSDRVFVLFVEFGLLAAGFAVAFGL